MVSKIMDGAVETKEIQSRQIDIHEILNFIPHRYPFLMVDRVLEFVDNERIVTIKNVSVNEPFFSGHFPGQPVMPGVMMLEALAQAGALLARLSSNGISGNRMLYLAGVQDFRWKKKVGPGDCLKIEMRFLKKRRPLWIMEGDLTVEGVLVASGKITAGEVG